MELNRKKFYYFYKITNNINNHYYYGIHSTNDLFDGYMGSGTRLKYAIKKYGLENFTKEILKFFNSWDELCEYENNVVNETLLTDPNCYNLINGGYNLTEEEIDNLSKTLKEREHQKGEKNSRYKTCWVTKDNISKSIYLNDLNDYLNNGWVRGRKMSQKAKEKFIANNPMKGKVWIHDINNNAKPIDKSLSDEYLNNGWFIGRCEKNITKVNKPIKNCVIVEDLSGKRFKISKDDPNYSNYLPFNKGKVRVQDSNGNRFYVSINDPRYISKELIPVNQSAKGKVIVKDKNNIIYRVDKNDPRYLSGELTFISKGFKHSDKTKEKIKESKSKGEKTWVCNDNTSKYINKSELSEYLNNGWTHGKRYNKHK